MPGVDALGPESRNLRALDLLFQGLPDVRARKLTLLEVLEREVEALARGHRERLPAVAELLRLHAPWTQKRRAPDDDLFARPLSPDEARDTIAGLHRFDGWADVVAHGQETVDHLFEAAADAIVAGDADKLRTLIAQQPSLVKQRSPYKHRSALIHYVAANGVEEMRQWQSPPNAVEIARILLEAGADPDATCPCYGPNDTPMTLLVTSGHPAGAGVQADLVEVLCRAGAKPDGLDDDGMPLWMAIRFGYTPAAERLARCGARIDNLLFAAVAGDLVAVRACFDEQGNLKPGQGWGRAAAVARDLDAEHLLEHAFIQAAAHGRREAVEFLLTKGPDLKFVEPVWGNTALSAARYQRRAEIVALLEAAGIEYRIGNQLDLAQVIDLYRASTLGERRPIDDAAIMADMVRHANLVVTAWDGPTLVGIARTLTDFTYVGYLADLAVRASHQKRGIGRALIEQTRDRMGPRSMLVLLAAPKAVDYYPRLGFKRHDSAWILRRDEPLAGDV